MKSSEVEIYSSIVVCNYMVTIAKNKFTRVFGQTRTCTVLVSRAVERLPLQIQFQVDGTYEA